jgi:type IV secretion system protein VirB1
MYNTGSQTRGFRNGYVAKVLRNAGVAQGEAASAPLILAAASPIPNDQRTRLLAENAVPEPSPVQVRPAPPPSWNVFERAAYDRETQFLAENERPSI